MGMAKSVIEIDKSNATVNKVNSISQKYGLDKPECRLLSPRDLVLQVMKDKIAEIDVNTCEPGEEDAFYVADLGEVYRQHLRWKVNLSRVKPFYGKFTPKYHWFFPSNLSQLSNAILTEKCCDC